MINVHACAQCSHQPINPLSNYNSLLLSMCTALNELCYKFYSLVSPSPSLGWGLGTACCCCAARRWLVQVLAGAIAGALPAGTCAAAGAGWRRPRSAPHGTCQRGTGWRQCNCQMPFEPAGPERLGEGRHLQTAGLMFLAGKSGTPQPSFEKTIRIHGKIKAQGRDACSHPQHAGAPLALSRPCLACEACVVAGRGMHWHSAS